MWGQALLSMWKRRGGTKHADCEPLTAAETAVIKQMYGGEIQLDPEGYNSSVNGKKMAASMNGMPHGGSASAAIISPDIFAPTLLRQPHHGNKLDADHQGNGQAGGRFINKIRKLLFSIKAGSFLVSKNIG